MKILSILLYAPNFGGEINTLGWIWEYPTIGIVILIILFASFYFMRKRRKKVKETSVASEEQVSGKRHVDDYTKQEAIESLTEVYKTSDYRKLTRYLDAFFSKFNQEEQAMWMTRLKSKIQQSLVDSLEDRYEFRSSDIFLRLRSIRNEIIVNDEAEIAFDHYLMRDLFGEGKLIQAFDEYLDRIFTKSNLGVFEIFDLMETELEGLKRESTQSSGFDQKENQFIQDKIKAFSYKLISERIDLLYKEECRFLFLGKLNPDEVFDQKLPKLLADENIPQSRRFILKQQAEHELDEFFKSLRRKD